MTPQQIAADLLELFGPEGDHWTQGANARNAAGGPTAVVSDEACRWCIVGGWLRITGFGFGHLYEPQWNEFRKAFVEATGFGPTIWNDAAMRSWPEVKGLLEGMAAA